MDQEARCKADLDAALAALKEANRLLIRSIQTRDVQAIQKQTVKMRASRWRLRAALRALEMLMAGQPATKPLKN